ncbi:hypothetical protein [Micromonospora sp. WMMD710]|uniref:hypothetical protein n=1 Tax=Micromonospora sp. WMMD710 TaxID=3016085 RepID=UPI002416D728|nr:hypothetical protein [Micromonospora sp. WMMD710]MDG4757294.1 hypothetical protein [Micromonospora sp. WMMD710]
MTVPEQQLDNGLRALRSDLPVQADWRALRENVKSALVAPPGSAAEPSSGAPDVRIDQLDTAALVAAYQKLVAAVGLNELAAVAVTDPSLADVLGELVEGRRRLDKVESLGPSPVAFPRPAAPRRFSAAALRSPGVARRAGGVVPQAGPDRPKDGRAQGHKR